MKKTVSYWIDFVTQPFCVAWNQSAPEKEKKRFNHARIQGSRCRCMSVKGTWDLRGEKFDESKIKSSW